MATGKKPAASSTKYARRDYLVVVVIVLFLGGTELIEVASPRAIGKIVSREDGPASIHRRHRIIRERYFRRWPREIASPREP